MALGRKSIYTVITISYNENPEKPYKITVQANKNYGICDMKPRIGELLSDFQGRQINDDNVLIRLENAIDEELKNWEFYYNELANVSYEKESNIA